MDDRLILDFGRGSYTFFLPMARILEIERLCGDKSIIGIYEELSAGIGLTTDTSEPRFLGTGSARLKDIYEVIRCAAIGGGEADIAGESIRVSASDATKLVNEYVDGRPFTESAPVAWAILNATIMGVQLKKKADVAESESLTDEVK